MCDIINNTIQLTLLLLSNKKVISIEPEIRSNSNYFLSFKFQIYIKIKTCLTNYRGTGTRVHNYL